MKKLPDITEPPEDVDFWYEEIQGVKQIKRSQEKPEPPLIIKEIKPSISYDGVYNQNSFNKINIGDTNNIDKKTATRFLRGNYKIDARLDLHGYTEKEAFSLVSDFIKDSYIQNRRCVLIITGKGTKKDDTPWYESNGIINRSLIDWINHQDIRPFVLSITPAKQSDGGSGAFYVLIKRRRDLNKREIF